MIFDACQGADPIKKNKNIEESMLHLLVHGSIRYVPFSCGYSMFLPIQNLSHKYYKQSSYVHVEIQEFRLWNTPLGHVLYESILVKDMATNYSFRGKMHPRFPLGTKYCLSLYDIDIYQIGFSFVMTPKLIIISNLVFDSMCLNVIDHIKLFSFFFASYKADWLKEFGNSRSTSANLHFLEYLLFDTMNRICIGGLIL
jgi:hypothetical protein